MGFLGKLKNSGMAHPNSKRRKTYSTQRPRLLQLRDLCSRDLQGRWEMVMHPESGRPIKLGSQTLFFFAQGNLRFGQTTVHCRCFPTRIDVICPESSVETTDHLMATIFSALQPVSVISKAYRKPQSHQSKVKQKG